MEEIEITSKYVIDTIGAELNKKFSSYGFKFIKSKKHLIRNHSAGFDRILLSTYDGYPLNHQELFIDFFVRINKVEEIVNNFYDHRFRNPVFSKLSSTVDTNYNNLKEKSGISVLKEKKMCELCDETKISNQIIIHKKSDIDSIVVFLTDFIKHKAFQFFEINKDLHHLNKLLKKQIITYNHKNNLLIILRSLVIQFLIKDTDFKSSCKAYKEILKPANGFEKESINAFDQLVLFLNSSNQNV